MYRALLQNSAAPATARSASPCSLRSESPPPAPSTSHRPPHPAAAASPADRHSTPPPWPRFFRRPRAPPLLQAQSAPREHPTPSPCRPLHSPTSPASRPAAPTRDETGSTPYPCRTGSRSSRSLPAPNMQFVTVHRTNSAPQTPPSTIRRAVSARPHRRRAAHRFPRAWAPPQSTRRHPPPDAASPAAAPAWRSSPSIPRRRVAQTGGPRFHTAYPHPIAARCSRRERARTAHSLPVSSGTPAPAAPVPPPPADAAAPPDMRTATCAPRDASPETAPRSCTRHPRAPGSPAPASACPPAPDTPRRPGRCAPPPPRPRPTSALPGRAPAQADPPSPIPQLLPTRSEPHLLRVSCQYLRHHRNPKASVPGALCPAPGSKAYTVASQKTFSEVWLCSARARPLPYSLLLLPPS